MSDDPELDEVWLKHWPRLRQRLETVLDEMDDSLDTDLGFNAITYALLIQVFSRQTIAAAIERADEDVMEWIENAYDDWCKDLDKFMQKTIDTQAPSAP